MSKVETIREACIKANPSIKDLVFGCELEVQNYFVTVLLIQDRRGFVWLDKEESNMDFYGFAKSPLYFDEKHITKIIGRTIRLADVLLAIENMKITREELVQKLGIDTPQMAMYLVGKIVQSWNLLKDDLTQQSEETIDFLYELLREF